MFSDIQNFPNQFLTGLKIANSVDLKGLANQKIARCYLTGMGGSTLIGDLINDYFDGILSLKIYRDYQLPSLITANDLVIGASYSGNTEETLSAVQQALDLAVPIIILTHGGKLKDLALENNLPLVEIPACAQPRCAVGYFYAATVGLLSRLGLIADQKNDLAALTAFLSDHQTRHEQEGKKLAQNLQDKVPILYGPTELKGVCRIWKIKFNENSKTQSFYNVFPELNHNEMVGYTNLLMNPAIIYLKSQFMHPRILKRMDVMEKILSDKMSFYPVTLHGENRLQEMFDAHAIADYSSYYLALQYGVDPTPVDMVESFKKMMDS